MPWFPYLRGLAPTSATTNGGANLERHIGQAEFLQYGPPLGGDLRQVLRVAIALDAEGEAGRHHDPGTDSGGDVRERHEPADAAPQRFVVLG